MAITNYKKSLYNELKRWSETNPQIKKMLSDHDVKNSEFIGDFFIIGKKMVESNNDNNMTVELEIKKDGEPTYYLNVDKTKPKDQSLLWLQAQTIHKSILESYKSIAPKNNKEYSQNINAFNNIFNGKILDKQSIHFYAQSGSGKTRFLYSIAQHFITFNHSVIIVNANQLYLIVTKTFKTGDTEQIINSLKEVDILIIDGLGTEPIKEWFFKSVLYPVLESRSQNKKRIIFSSVFSIFQLEKVYERALKKEDFNGIHTAKMVTNRIKNMSYEFKFIPWIG